MAGRKSFVHGPLSSDLRVNLSPITVRCLRSRRQQRADGGNSLAACERANGPVDPKAQPTAPAWTRSLPETIIGAEPCAGTTMNVAQWLNAIDLGQYEALFREHEIDVGVLPDLVEVDLEKIGVPLGHRKRLIEAIAAL